MVIPLVIAASSYVYTLRLIGPISYAGGSPTKAHRHFLTSHECILLPFYVYNMHQDTKSARLIAVCKRTFILVYTFIYESQKL